MVSKGDCGTTLSAVFRDKREIPIFYSTWQRNEETLLIGETDFKNLDPKVDWAAMYEYVNRYLIKGKVKDLEYTNIEQGFSKTVWLSNELLSNGGFDYPICAHWNPRLGKNQIHPGSSRMVIYSLFNSDAKIKSYYFRTYRKWFDWLDGFKEISPGQMYVMMESDDLEIAISADHGTFIPHLTHKGGITTPKGEEWHAKCRDIVLSRTIYTNHDIEEHKIFHRAERETADIIFEFKKTELSIQDRMRISVLSFLDLDYEDDVIKVIVNKNE
jgi:hypothetical protein